MLGPKVPVLDGSSPPIEGYGTNLSPRIARIDGILASLEEIIENDVKIQFCHECGGAFDPNVMSAVDATWVDGEENEVFFCPVHCPNYDSMTFIRGAGWYYRKDVSCDESGTPSGYVPEEEVEERVAKAVEEVLNNLAAGPAKSARQAH